MTKFDKIKSLDFDGMVDWIYEQTRSDHSPSWLNWWDEHYCKKCPTLYLGGDTEVSHCEMYQKCFFFPDRESEPDSKEIIGLWLMSEAEEKGCGDA